MLQLIGFQKWLALILHSREIWSLCYQSSFQICSIASISHRNTSPVPTGALVTNAWKRFLISSPSAIRKSVTRRQDLDDDMHAHLREPNQRGPEDCSQEFIQKICQILLLALTNAIAKLKGFLAQLGWFLPSIMSAEISKIDRSAVWAHEIRHHSTIALLGLIRYTAGLLTPAWQRSCWFGEHTAQFSNKKDLEMTNNVGKFLIEQDLPHLELLQLQINIPTVDNFSSL